MTRRAIVLVLDGVGCGAARDAAAYGDEGSNTLGNIDRAVGGLVLPTLGALGLGNVVALVGTPPTTSPTAAWGRLHPASKGKDSTTGHWELAGVHLSRPFPTYPHGFPPDLVTEFSARTGRPVIANVVGSGTDVIDRYALEQQRSGAWILYTSADSVFQIAAHESWIPVDELYRACEAARALLVPPHDVSRVIARPFTGTPGAWRRTANRRDFALPPADKTLLDALAAACVSRSGVGKVDDLFANRSLTSRHSADNEEGFQLLLDWVRSPNGGFCFANLVDFDQLYGHRNDVRGFERALQRFDSLLPSLLGALRPDDLLVITADHGNDPTTASSDHAREIVPVLVVGAAIRPVSIGERGTFSDVGATVAEWFGLSWRGQGTSFLPALDVDQLAAE